MINPEVSPWISRALHNGVLGITPEESWKLQAYESYRTKLQAANFPCFFGQAGEIRGEMIYTFISQHFPQQFVRDMQEFVTLLDTAEYERCSLVAFCEPDPKITTHAAFVDRFWGLLQMLHEHDRHPALERTPNDPLWEFSFEGCEMFVVGSSPTYIQRRSRNLGPGIVLIFQPRRLFIDPATSQPIAAEVRHRIHRRMLAYDEMSVHPDIGFYGQPTNREWKQYALPDDNSPETGSCPFHTRRP
jgi:FPC/CPF motif-containing protein YcgG